MLIGATIYEYKRIRLQIYTNVILSGFHLETDAIIIFNLLCSAQNTLLIGKPGYLNNFLKRSAILSTFRTSDAILFDGGTTKSVIIYLAFSSVIHRTWNILPYDLSKIQSSYCFIIKLKNHLNSV